MGASACVTFSTPVLYDQRVEPVSRSRQYILPSIDEIKTASACRRMPCQEEQQPAQELCLRLHVWNAGGDGCKREKEGERGRERVHTTAQG